jgi:hypothetical protein
MPQPCGIGVCLRMRRLRYLFERICRIRAGGGHCIGLLSKEADFSCGDRSRIGASLDDEPKGYGEHPAVPRVLAQSERRGRAGAICG